MSRKDTKTRQKEIIEATLQLLGESGTQNLTTAGIAERVGISEAALYRHFDDKFDIIGSSIEFVGDKMESKLSRVPEGETGIGKLKLVFFRHLEYIEENPGNARLLFSDDIHFDDEKLRSLLRKVVEKRRDFIKEIVVEGQEAGEISTGIDAEGISLMLIGLIQANVLLWSLSGRSYSLKDQSRSLWQAFAESITR